MTEQTTPTPAEEPGDTDHLADIRSLPAWEELLKTWADSWPFSMSAGK